MLSSDPNSAGQISEKGRNRFALLAGSILIGMALALLLFGDGLLGLSDDQEGLSALEQLPDDWSSSTAELPASNHLIEVGDRAHSFELEDLDGNAHKLFALRGRPVVINFWATWCVPCRVEMPELQAAYELYQDEGLTILAIDYDEPIEAVRSFFVEMGLTFTPLLDVEGRVSEQYGVYNFPSTFFINAEGVVKSVHRGPMIRQQIEDHLSKIIPTHQ